MADSKFAVYFTDGTSKMVTLTRPPGCHPNALRVLYPLAVDVAERGGKRVDRIATPVFVGDVVIDTNEKRRYKMMRDRVRL